MREVEGRVLVCQSGICSRVRVFGRGRALPLRCTLVQRSYNMRNNWKIWLGFLISIMALIWTFSGINFSDFFTSLRQANLLWFIPGMLAWFVTLIARAKRWSILMNDTPFGITFHAMNIGYLLNCVLPGRVGEVGRAFVIGERTELSSAKAMSSVVVERLFDLAVVVILFVIFAQFIPMSIDLARGAIIAGGLVLVLLVAASVMIWQAARVEQLLAYLLRRFAPQVKAEPWLQRFRELCAGFKIIGTPGRFWNVIGLTAVIWAATIVFAFLVMAGFFTPRWDQSGLMIIVANLAGALPSAPAGLGVVQGFASKALIVPFGMGAQQAALATAYVFVWSLVQILALILFGLFGLATIGMSFSQVTRRT